MVRIHGGRERSLPKSLLEKKVSAFPSTCGGAGSASAPAWRRSGGLGSQGHGGSLASCEKARRQWSGEEEGASPAPLFIAGAW